MKKSKINLEQANELLHLLGVAAAVVDNTDDNPADADVDVQGLIKGIKEPNEDFIREKLRAEIEDKIKTQNTGKWINSLRSKVAQTFGIKTSSLSDLSLEEILTMAKESTKGNVDKAQQDWLNDREKLIGEHDAEVEKLKGEYERQLRDAHTQYVRRDMRDRFISVLNNMPRTGGDLNAQAEALLAAAEKQFTLKYDEEKGRVGLFTKGDEPAPVFKGKKILSDEDFAEEFAEKMGWKRTDNRGIPPVPKNDSQQEVPPSFGGVAPKKHIPDNIPEHARRTLERLNSEIEAEE